MMFFPSYIGQQLSLKPLVFITISIKWLGTTYKGHLVGIVFFYLAIDKTKCYLVEVKCSNRDSINKETIDIVLVYSSSAL